MSLQAHPLNSHRARPNKAGELRVATDGSALRNPGPAGWCWFVNANRWDAGGLVRATNNVAELTAVHQLLIATRQVDERLVVECDSRYVIDAVTRWVPQWRRRNWITSSGSPVKNRELLEDLMAELDGRQITFEWVKGHRGHHRNESADVRARAAATRVQRKQGPLRGPGWGHALGLPE